MKILLLILLILSLVLFSASILSAPKWISLGELDIGKLPTNLYYLDGETRYVKTDTMRRYPFFLVKSENQSGKIYFIIIMSCDNNDYLTQIVAVGNKVIKGNRWNGPYNLEPTDPLFPVFNKFCSVQI